MKHLISTKQFSSAVQLKLLFNSADQSRTPAIVLDNLLTMKNRPEILATLFYQPSTRTRLSFETAMYRIGGKVISCENALDTSSFTKGESLEDTVRTVSEFADIIALRHFERGAIARVAQFSEASIINAGDGDGEHPTQALLDVYTMHRELGSLDEITVALVGDLLYGRTVHSLIYLLGLFKSVNLITCNPPHLGLPGDIQKFITDRQYHSMGWRTKHAIEQVMYERPDVIYMTRSQQHNNMFSSDFCFGRRELDMLGDKSIVLHPLPRQNEIDPVVDSDSRMCYWKQVQNGVCIRGALMEAILSGSFPWN